MFRQTHKLTSPRRLTWIVCALYLFFSPTPNTHAQSLYITTSSDVLRLIDTNQDGDFLDSQEQQLYATDLSTSLGALCHTEDRLILLDLADNTLIALEDLNDDGDAQDIDEMSTFAVIPDTPSLSPLSDLVCLPDSAILVARKDNGTLYRACDLNADGDAFDMGEVTQAASGLTAPIALTARPDGAILVAQESPTQTVRILRDLNGDGDYFDFAENLAYAESLATSCDLIMDESETIYLSHPSANTISKLHDLTGDDDCLDYGETALYLDDIPTPRHLATNDAGDLLIASEYLGNPLYLARDLNGDGDALDAGEITLVGNVTAPVSGMTFLQRQSPCVPGDYSGDQQVNLEDLPLFVAVLVGQSPITDMCAADVNQDGAVNGLDIQWMVWRLSSG